MRVVVLGASGMLGSMLVDFLSRDSALEVTATVRGESLARTLKEKVPGVRSRLLDAERCGSAELLEVLNGARWAVNAIGVIKPYVHDDNAAEIYRAVQVNSLFPHVLARAAEQCGCRVLQIATDCVYSGSKGNYVENDPHDALDVYGKTKSLGEVYSSNVFQLRCSIIGPEIKTHVSLLDWFLDQERGTAVNGFTNHQWNGVTTLHFARLCQGIMTAELDLPHLQHVVPAGVVSKCELLQHFAREFQREDLSIQPAEARTVIDRTLNTTNQTLNRRIWACADYDEPPTISRMVQELAHFDHSLGDGQR